MTQFISQYVRNFNIGSHATTLTQVAVVGFAETFFRHFSLNATRNQAQLQAQIASITQGNSSAIQPDINGSVLPIIPILFIC